MKIHVRFKRFIKNDPNQKKIILFTISGDKGWFLNGEPHRLDGPAYEGRNGEKYYYLNGIRYTKEHWIALEEYKKNR